MAEQEAREDRKHTKRERPHQSGTQNKQHNVPSSAKQPRIRIRWHPRDPPPHVQRARLTADRHRGAGRADTRSAAHGWGKRARWPGVVPRRGRGRSRRHTAADTGTRPRPPRPSGTPGATSLSVRKATRLRRFAAMLDQFPSLPHGQRTQSARGRLQCPSGIVMDTSQTHLRLCPEGQRRQTQGIGFCTGHCLVIQGGGEGGGVRSEMGLRGILADPVTHPLTSANFSSAKKKEIYQRGPNLQVDFRYTNFVLTSDPTPYGHVWCAGKHTPVQENPRQWYHRRLSARKKT